MSTLVVDELTTTLEQDIELGLDKRYQLNGAHLYIYMHNAPAGTFTVSVKDGATTLVSQDFTSAEFQTDLGTTDTYAYGWKPVTFSNTPLKKGVYSVELSSTGYSFSESSYIGWIRPYYDAFIETTSTPLNDFQNPFGVYFFTKRLAGYL